MKPPTEMDKSAAAAAPKPIIGERFDQIQVHLAQFMPPLQLVEAAAAAYAIFDYVMKRRQSLNLPVTFNPDKPRVKDLLGDFTGPDADQMCTQLFNACIGLNRRFIREDQISRLEAEIAAEKESSERMAKKIAIP